MLRLPFFLKRGVLYFYNEGTENVDWVAGYSSGTGSVSKESTYLKMYASDPDGKAERVYVTDNTIDFTDIDFIAVNFCNVGVDNSGNKSFLNISSNKTGDYITYDLNVYLFSGQVDTETYEHPSIPGNPFDFFKVDVRDLSGNYYIRFHALDDDSKNADTSDLRVRQVFSWKPTNTWPPYIIADGVDNVRCTTYPFTDYCCMDYYKYLARSAGGEGTGTTRARTDNKVDFTGYDTLKIEWAGSITTKISGSFAFQFNTDGTIDNYEERLCHTSSFSKTIESIDISSYQGEYYLHWLSTISSGSPGYIYMYIKKVWLE